MPEPAPDDIEFVPEGPFQWSCVVEGRTFHFKHQLGRRLSQGRIWYVWGPGGSDHRPIIEEPGSQQEALRRLVEHQRIWGHTPEAAALRGRIAVEALEQVAQLMADLSPALNERD